MKIGFVLTSGSPVGYVAGDFFLRSARAVMPGVEVVQFSDMDSPVLLGVDNIYRLPTAPFTLLIAEHWARLEGDWLLSDTDVVIQRDVRPVFDELTFDLAVATREGTFVEGEQNSDFMLRMPYNCGVVYSRSTPARRAIRDKIAAMSPEDQKWNGIQLAMATMRPLLLYNTFNYPPRSADDRIDDKHIVHYKGPWRKQLLLKRIFQEVVCA